MKKFFNKKLITEDLLHISIKKKKTFRDNESFFKWINKNKENIKNVKIYVNNENVRVIYDKM